MFDRWFNRAGVTWLDNELTTLPSIWSHATIRPGAKAIRGWRHLNRPTVCTVGAVAPGARFLRFKERVSQVHSRGSVNCRTRDNKLGEGDFQEAYLSHFSTVSGVEKA